MPAYLSAPTALFQAGFQDIDSLHRRLGGNWLAAETAQGSLRLGLAGTIGSLWLQPSAVDGPSKARFDTHSLAGMATWQARAGWYFDALVTGGWSSGAVTTPSRGRTASLHGSAVAASLDTGYPIPLGWQGLALEPQLQLVYQHLAFDQRTDVDGIRVQLGSPDQGIFRAGLRLTRPFAGPDGARITPYLEANLLQGLGGGATVRLGGVAFGTGAFGTTVQIGADVIGTLRHNLALYGDVARQQDVGNGGIRGWAFNGGLRYTF